jgi:hypothetical protein
MGVTENFRRQHEDLLALAFEIAPLLAEDAVARDPAAARRALARFAGRLRVHAAMENDALYPRLLAHRDPTVRARAEGLYEEVGRLYADFDAFMARFPDAAALAVDPSGFARSTRAVLRALGVRMARENEELYPLVDAAEADERTRAPSPEVAGTGSLSRSNAARR